MPSTKHDPPSGPCTKSEVAANGLSETGLTNVIGCISRFFFMLHLLVAGTPTSASFVETSSQVVQKHCHISSFWGMMMPAAMFSQVARSDPHLLFFSSITLPGVLLYPSGSASILLPCVWLAPSWSTVVLHLATCWAWQARHLVHAP